jgi:uncharacterized glyoxalase superfamily protein PhnB
MPSTPQYALVPQLPYGDGPQAVAWLEHAFGFREALGARSTAPSGAIHTELVAPLGGVVMIGSAGGHGVYPPGSSGRPSMILSIYVEDVDAHCENARAVGAVIVADPENKPWGDRVYECVDPEGHRWRFHQRLR